MNIPNNHATIMNIPNNHATIMNIPNNHATIMNIPNNHAIIINIPNNHATIMNIPNNHAKIFCLTAATTPRMEISYQSRVADEVSLLTPDWDDDADESDTFLQRNFQETITHGFRPSVSHARVAFADLNQQQNATRDLSPTRPRQALTSPLAETNVKDTNDSVNELLFLQDRPFIDHKYGNQTDLDISSGLQSLPTVPFSYRSFEKSQVLSAPRLSTLPQFSAVVDLEAKGMSFSQPSAVCEDLSMAQNIELSTLKFMDSPSLDDTLPDCYLPSSPHINSCSTASTVVNDFSTLLSSDRLHSHPVGRSDDENGNIRNVQRSINDPIHNTKHLIDSMEKSEIANYTGFVQDTPIACCTSCLHINSGGSYSDMEFLVSDHSNTSHHLHNSSCALPSPYKRLHQVSYQEPDIETHHHDHHNSGVGNMSRHSIIPSPQNPYYQQTCCSAGGHPSFNSDRRLPDYVTIDQCYSGVDDSECRTICLIANFDVGGAKKDNDHREDQAPAPGKGVQGETVAKKEKTPVRRSVVVRQVSVNQAKMEQPINLPSEMRSGDNANQNTEPVPSVKITDPWESSPSIRRLSTCSFSRIPVKVSQPPSTPGHSINSLATGQCVGMEADGSGSESLSKDEGTENTACDLQPHGPSSPSVRMKMKNLGLSNVAVNRFRLTFDEVSDADSNRNNELPIEVTPHSLTTKRPSCIRGEPEYPPADYFSQLQKSGDAPQPTDGTIRDMANGVPGIYPYPAHEGLLNNSSSHFVPIVNNPYSYYPLPSPHSPIPTHVTSSQPDHEFDSLFLNVPNLRDLNQNCAMDDHSSSNKVQTQPDGGYPKVTICISNSQQSLIPYSCESPTFDQPRDDHVHENDYMTYYQNNNQYIKDACHGRCTDSTGYNNFAQQQHFHHSDYSDGLASDAEEIRLLSMQDTESLLQHQDTMSAPPIQDLYRYHVFFSHCPEDRDWVEHIVAHLEAPPFNYTCAYASLQDEADPATLQQRILCAAMLSERVVLVLSKKYVEDVWFSFEKTLKQLTKMSLHNQRIMGVLLEDCEIPESLGELYFLDSSDPDFFQVFAKRLKTSRIPRSSASVSSDLGQNAITQTNVTNGKILTFCRLQVKVGWDSFLIPADGPELDIPTSLSAHGIGMEKTEFGEIVTKVSGIVNGSNKLPWLLSARPMLALLLAGVLWLPAFIAVLVIHVDDDSGIALPIRLAVFLFPLGLVAAGYLIKWRRAYWLTKIVRLLVQNCVDVNQALYFQGRPLFVTAAHVRANLFAIYFVYFDATDCVRSVDLLLFTCMEEDWEKLLRLITFYTRDENYLSRMSVSERLTVMMSAPYLVKLVKQVLPHPPQQRHVSRLLCLCQFTEECISRFAHGLDREDVPGLAELFTRHMPGKVSGSAARRVQEELFHANHGLVP